MDRHPLSYLRTGAIGSAIFAVAWALLGVANFYEKALFVKPTWRPYVWWMQLLSARRAMLLSALSVSPLSSVALCIG